jgi:hypothetical protein
MLNGNRIGGNGIAPIQMFGYILNDSRLRQSIKAEPKSAIG